MNKLTHFCMLSAFAVSGCLHTGGDASQPRNTAVGEIKLINPSAPWLDINNYAGLGPLSGADDRTLDEALRTRCGVPSNNVDIKAFGFLAAALPIVAGWVIDYVIAMAQSAAQRRLAEYSAVTSASLKFGPPDAGYFYSSAPPAVLGVRCVQLRRIQPPGPNGGLPTLASEAIVLIETTPPKDALLITPLRLYFDKPLARTGSGRDPDFSVSVGATFDALWQAEQTGEGKATRVWGATIAAQKISQVNDKDSPTRKRFFYYNLDPTKPVTNPPVAVPLVPWSVPDRTGENKAGGKSLGAGKLTLVLAEVGDPPLILELVAGTLKDHGKDIGDFLKDAAKKAIEKDGGGTAATAATR